MATHVEWTGTEWTMVQTNGTNEEAASRDMTADVCRWMLMHLRGCRHNTAADRLEHWISMHGTVELGRWINGILKKREYDMWVAGLDVAHRLAELDRRLYGATGRG